MPILIGTLLALVVCTYASAAALDRDRALYPAMLVVVGSYYVLFGAMGGGGTTLGIEIAIAGIFVIAGMVGFLRNLWIVAIGLMAHGMFDAVHSALVRNPGVPVWWPAFCGAFDMTAGAWLAWMLVRRAIRTTQAECVCP